MVSIDFFYGLLVGAVAGVLACLAFLWLLGWAYEIGHKVGETNVEEEGRGAAGS